MKVAVLILGALVSTALADHRDGKFIFFIFIYNFVNRI